MKRFLITGDDVKQLDALLKEHDFEITYRGRHTPVREIQTEQELERVQEMFPSYLVTEQKTYEADTC